MDGAAVSYDGADQPEHECARMDLERARLQRARRGHGISIASEYCLCAEPGNESWFAVLLRHRTLRHDQGGDPRWQRARVREQPAEFQPDGKLPRLR